MIRPAYILAAFFCLAGSCAQAADESPAPLPFVWRIIASDNGRSIEVDNASVQRLADGKVLVTSRLVLDKEIVDIRSENPYKYIQTQNRYDCSARNSVTLKRSFLARDETVLREENLAEAQPVPVRSNTLEEKVMREICRPMGGRAQAQVAADALRQSNEALLRKQLDSLRAAVGKPANVGKTATVVNPRQGGQGSSHAAGQVPERAPKTPLTWSYSGPGGPEHWAKVAAENLLCKEGRRQSPIDIRDGIEVDLEPVRFDYRPGRFSIIDTGRGIEVRTSGAQVSLMGKAYQLERMTFQYPAEETIDGQGFVMGIHFEHRAPDGERLNVALLLERGESNPVIQTLWNYLPLERNREVAPNVDISLAQLLPDKRGYHTFMGSMTRPPCEEGVIWVVLQTPVTLSLAQENIFARLYPALARPTQPTHGRRIKSSIPK
ncbi:MAG: carbonic anhydrase family protein [Zoogloeaceae bacterium]|jgi:carbonic anhydrase|nr:carbonic anhydrase family protein [Zoogloeaceae bacterium]